MSEDGFTARKQFIRDLKKQIRLIDRAYGSGRERSRIADWENSHTKRNGDTVVADAELAIEQLAFDYVMTDKYERGEADAQSDHEG